MPRFALELQTVGEANVLGFIGIGDARRRHYVDCPALADQTRPAYRRAVRHGSAKALAKTPNTALSSMIRRSHHAANASPATAVERDTPAIISSEGYSRVAPLSVPVQKKNDGVATREFAKIHRWRRNYRSGLSAWLS